MMETWLQFFFCLLLIAYAGYQLCWHADVISEKTGLSGSLVGVVLLATVTSLPELATGISSVTVAMTPEIAVGNILGACTLNLLMIAILDALLRRQSFFRQVAKGHVLTAALGMLMAAFVGFNLLLKNHFPNASVWHIGLSTPLILIFYVLSMRLIQQYEGSQQSQSDEQSIQLHEDISLRRAIVGYLIAALVVVLAAVWLPFVADELATQMGWNESFVGTVLVAVATTAPEAAVTLSALRIGALDMALANLLGSNLFNITILAVDDIFFQAGPLLASVSDMHALTAFVVVMMSGVVIVALTLRPTSRIMRTVSWASLALFALYMLNATMLYLSGND